MSLRVLTWHVHGSYLSYLAHSPHTFVLPVTADRGEGYGGRTPSFSWPDNVVEVPAEAVRDEPFDVVLTQSVRNWVTDRHELLPPDRLAELPRIHLEHDPPRGCPNDARHPVQDPDATLVHVTPFNALMWDSGITPTRVIEHGVVVPPGLQWSGEFDRGVTVVNNLARRGRRLGPDIFASVRRQVPIDLAGMGSADFGGPAHGVLGDLRLADLHRRLPSYRFFLNPIRYTSLGLAVCEAMALGLPVLGLATTELVTVVRQGVEGYVETDPQRLVEHARRLLADRDEATALSTAAAARAAERFGIDRFARDWDDVLRSAARTSVLTPVVGSAL